jgi:hypothetical protein
MKEYKWIPKEGDRVWFISQITLDVYSSSYLHTDFDILRFNNGWIRRTKKEACEVASKLRAILKGG